MEHTYWVGAGAWRGCAERSIDVVAKNVTYGNRCLTFIVLTFSGIRLARSKIAVWDNALVNFIRHERMRPVEVVCASNIGFILYICIANLEKSNFNWILIWFIGGGDLSLMKWELDTVALESRDLTAIPLRLIPVWLVILLYWRMVCESWGT